MDRLDLQRMLEDISGLATDQFGNPAVYFQPPANVLMVYPAIRYERSNIGNVSADNDIYRQSHHYQITVIDKNPDSDIVDSVSKIPKIRFVRHYTSNNLNHDVFELYY